MERYQFMDHFEANHKIIYEEFLTIKDRIYPWPELRLHKGGWMAFGLHLGSEYEYIADIVEEGLTLLERDCPITRGLIEEYVPFHGTAGFSILKANSDIHPHRGIESPFNRMHLSLKVPKGDLGLEVEGYGVFRWEVGKSFHFKDVSLHQAWNRSDEDRVIFLLDFDTKLSK
jgi:ornithine lipid ester-linked acyl 2-hydroxylase